KTGRESQVCAQHAVPVTLLRARAGLAEFSDQAVADPAVRALGTKVTFVDDTAYSVDSATVTLVFTDNHVLEQHIDNARGSVANPLSEEDLIEKLASLCQYSRVSCEVDLLAAQVLNLQTLTDVSAL